MESALMSEDNDKKEFPIRPERRKMVSESGFRFQYRHELIFNFFLFNVRLATRSDEMRMKAAKALAFDGDEEGQRILSEAQKNPNANFEYLQRFGEYQSETMVIRSVDNFLSYITEILQTCMKQKRELLHSKEQISIDEIMQFSNIKELNHYIISKKINTLSYGGLNDVNDFLKSRTKISISESQEKFDLLNYTIEIRNLYTHNRGIVNHIFQRKISSKIKNKKIKIGDYIHTDLDNIIELTNNMYLIFSELDDSLSKKFKIKRKLHSTWRKNNAYENATIVSLPG